MAATQSADQLVGILRDTVVALVRRDGPDLSARQLGVFLTCYLQEGAHTVRGLAADLNVSKPAITRALDRLGELDLARRKVDPMDRRSVLVQRTSRAPRSSAICAHHGRSLDYLAQGRDTRGILPQSGGLRSQLGRWGIEALPPARLPIGGGHGGKLRGKAEEAGRR